MLFQTDVNLAIQATSQDKYPFAYTLAGTVPDTNTAGGITGNNFALDADAIGSVFNYQFCGEAEREL